MVLAAGSSFRMLWTTAGAASMLARDEQTKTLPAGGGEGGPDDREEEILSHPDLGGLIVAQVTP
jgi:hypothetical protein